VSPTTFRPRLPERDAALVQLGVRSDRFDHLVALAGNPNVGKSTVFNALTGLRQHTGNWPGKTVTRAEGLFTVGGTRFKLVDLPGTYSLQAASDDEEVARDMLLFGRPDVTVLVLDATRLERNLNLALQVLEVTSRVVVCLNLVDEARRVGAAVDPAALSRELGVPVVATAARQGEGLDAHDHPRGGHRRGETGAVSRGALCPRRRGADRRSAGCGAAGLSGAAECALGGTAVAERRRTGGSGRTPRRVRPAGA
jgi:energy-coupling factor transporter ATP-binding protein EcfA2